MSDQPDKPKLTAKQQTFVAAYLDCLNATEAARRAKYANPRQAGSENLSKPDIAAVLREAFAARTMPADEVLARLSEHARGDIGEFLGYGPDGEPWLKVDSRAATRLIRKVKITRNSRVDRANASVELVETRIELELYSAQEALTTIAKHYALLNPIPWEKIPKEILAALAEGKVDIDDIRRLAAPSAE